MVQETEEDKSFLQSTADFFKNLDYGQLAEESIPLVGENIIIGDIKENLKEGSLGSAALNTAALGIGVIPGAGDLVAMPFRALAKKYSKAQNALKEAIKNKPTDTRLAEPVTSFFKTGKGSEYVMNKGNITTRHKTVTGENLTPSAKTIFLDEEAATIFKDDFASPNQLQSQVGGEGYRKIIPAPNSPNTTANIILETNKGPVKKAEFNFSLTPKKGLHPLEILQNGTHIGNPITQVDNVTAADILAYNKKELKMAEGGPVMALEEQTEMAFGDEPPRIDPVSGNEVPPGALPSEVRDDIPAQLSEGEYVVPADVLQYYGIKFFEDLRGKAKMELASMEENGRMGGEPLQEAPMEALPFTAEELNKYDDGAEAPVRQFDEGGPVTEMGSIFPQSYIKTYVNDAGSKLYIRFINGIAVPPVPPGYVEEGSTIDAVDTVEPVSTPVDEPEGPDEITKPLTLADVIEASQNPPFEIGGIYGKGAELIDKLFPTNNTSEIMAYVDRFGKLPSSGRGVKGTGMVVDGFTITDTIGDGFAVHPVGHPLAGTIVRESTDDDIISSTDLNIFKTVISPAYKKNTNKDGTFNKKGYIKDIKGSFTDGKFVKPDPTSDKTSEPIISNKIPDYRTSPVPAGYTVEEGRNEPPSDSENNNDFTSGIGGVSVGEAGRGGGPDRGGDAGGGNSSPSFGFDGFSMNKGGLATRKKKKK